MRLLKWLQVAVNQTARELPAARKTFGGRALLAFLALYILAFAYCRHSYSHDPTSFFFDPLEGYKPQYSRLRHEQALEYLDSGYGVGLEHAGKLPTTCVGIATLGRPREQYVKATIGSLLEGLRDRERRDIDLIVLIANTNPADHPIYGEQWLKEVVDKVLIYNSMDPDFDHLRYLEQAKLFPEKMVYDYTFVLDECYKTGASLIAMFEDDVLALRGWYARALKASSDVDDRDGLSSWLYLRLFFTEEFLGWNAEEWPRYAVWSIVIICSAVAALTTARSLSSSLQKQMSNRFIASTSLVCAPACILLYFMSGRLSMQPLPPGVFEMPHFGCCSQGLVFNRRLVPELVDWLRERKAGQIDSLVEQWANEQSLPRWAVSPSLLQHIGAKSSREDDFGSMSKYNMTVAQKIWNFQFEESSVSDLERLEDQAMKNEQSLYGVREKINSWPP